jgi:hypothetical protein
VIEGIVEACIALVLAELCFQLIEAETVIKAGPATGEMASGGIPESGRRGRRVADHEA